MLRSTLLMTAIAGVSVSIALAEEPNPDAPKTVGMVESYDPAFDALVDSEAVIEVLAKGFKWSEGPVWVPKDKHLLFSDVPRNHILRWKDSTGLDTFRKKSGYSGPPLAGGREPGSNGLVLDTEGRLVVCQHGDRRIVRIEHDGTVTVLADKYNGKRFSSPNDLAYHSSGDLYFTDPPYGLTGGDKSPEKEIPFNGVYRLDTQGKVTLLDRDMTRPNGIAFSPDEKTLYVAQSDGKAAIWKAYDVQADGSVKNGRVFYDMTKWMGKRPGSPDGMTVDTQGNLWATAPGGVVVISPKGKLLGRISTGQATANCTFGDDGSTLYMTANMLLCRIRTKAKGVGF